LAVPILDELPRSDHEFSALNRPMTENGHRPKALSTILLCNTCAIPCSQRHGTLIGEYSNARGKL
jgi:hypothetical protein